MIETVRKTIAILIILIMSLAIFPMAFLTALGQTYLNPNFYESVNFQKAVVPILWDGIAQQWIETYPEIAAEISTETIQQALKNNIPESALTDQLESVVNQLKQEPFPEEITLSTQGIKPYLSEVIDELSLGEKTEDYKTKIETLPAQFTFSTEGFPESMQTGLSVISNQHLILEGFVTWIITMTGLVGLVIWKPLPKAIEWMGTTLFLNGLFLFFGVKTIGNFIIASEITGIPTESAKAILNPIFANLGWIYFFLIGLGIVGWLAGFSLRKSNTSTV